MPHNLLTFAPADRDAAERLNEQFHQWNLDTELAPDSFSREAVEDCASIVLLVSGQTSASDRVRIELAWALGAKKRILPILIEKTSLLPFPFLVERQDIDYTADPVTVMKRLIFSLKGIQPYRIEPPELPPRSSDTPSDEAIVAVDEDMAAALFFAAAELSENAVEQAIFLYNTLLRYAPDYMDGQLNGFMSSELERLQPMWLQNLNEIIFRAVRKRDYQRARHLVHQIQSWGIPAVPTGQASLEAHLSVRLEALNQQIKWAIENHEWNDVEALTTTIARIDNQMSGILQQGAGKSSPAAATTESTSSDGHDDTATADLLYEQARYAVDANRWNAAGFLVWRIQQLSPDYGDPQKLLRGQLMQAPFVGYIGEVTRLEAHSSNINVLLISNDGTIMVTGSRATLLVWEMPSFEPIHVFKDPDWVGDAALSPDNEHLAILSLNGILRVWSLDRGNLVREDTVQATKIAFSPDGKLLAVGMKSGMIVLWNTYDWKLVDEWSASTENITYLTFSADGARLAITDEHGKVIIYDVAWQVKKADFATMASGFERLHSRILRWSGNVPVNSVAFVSDGEQVLGTSVVSFDGVRLWNIDGEIVKAFNAPNHSSSIIAVSPDESLLVTAGRLEGAIGFWDLQTGKLLKRLRNDARGVGGLAFTPDGMSLVIGDSNGNVTFWGVGGADKTVVHKGKRG